MRLQLRSVQCTILALAAGLLAVVGSAATAATCPAHRHLVGDRQAQMVCVAIRGHQQRPHQRPHQRPVHGRRVSARLADASTPGFFSSGSVWNQVVASDAALDPASGAVLGNLMSQYASQLHGIATTSYGVPIYTVAASQAMVPVTLSGNNVALAQAFATVPLPDDAVAAAGTDGNLAVYQPSSDTMWEFWRLTKTTAGWHAQGGGRMMNVSSDPGYYRNISDSSGNLLEHAWWGAPATSFPLVAGVMTISELQAGQINHALALAIGNPRAGAWAWPAQRSDGVSTDPNAVPEGAHFRLDPTLDLSTLHLPHFIYMMAVAAQKYGIIINNRSAGFNFRAEDPGQYVKANGYNPYMGPANQPGTPGALFDQWPSAMLKLFPWSHLQLLKMDLRTTPDPTVLTLPAPAVKH